MSNELQLRTSIIEKILKMHEELLWPCIDRWIAWRPTDHLAELRRLRAQHNPDSARQLRLPSLDDPSFFFWSIFNTQEEVFPEFANHPKISLRRIIGIRNAGAHGDKVSEESLRYLESCGAEMLRILTSKATTQSAASVPPAPPPPAPSVPRPFVRPPAPRQPTVQPATPPTPPPPPRLQSHLSQILAFYVVCDKSASMAGDPIEVVNENLAEMHRTLISDPVIADKCWMGVMSFSSLASVELPLSPPHQVLAMPQIDAEGITNYGRAFSLVKSQIDIDLPRLSQTHRPLRPVVFFLTDGSPSDATWKADLEKLVDASETYAPTLVVFPVGDVDESTISEFANVPNGITPQVLRMDTSISLTESVRRAIQSITSSVVNTLRNDDAFLSIDGVDPIIDPDFSANPDEWI